VPEVWLAAGEIPPARGEMFREPREISWARSAGSPERPLCPQAPSKISAEISARSPEPTRGPWEISPPAPVFPLRSQDISPCSGEISEITSEISEISARFSPVEMDIYL
jgi:hypothetical protein